MKRGRSLTIVALATAVVGELACIHDNSAGPRSGRASLGIRAAVYGMSQGGVASIRVHAFYQTSAPATIPLPSAPSSVSITAPTVTTQPVVVDLAPCLNDPQRVPAGQPGCQVSVSLVLVTLGNQVADSQTVVSGLAILPGGAADMPPITLTVPSGIRLSRHALAAGLKAPGVGITAIVRDGLGRLLPGHPVSWRSADTTIATVTQMGPDSAVITGINPGVTQIGARSGGIVDLAQVYVSGAPIPLIELSQVAVTDTFSLSAGIDPPAITIALSDGGTAPLTGVSLDTVVYNPVTLTRTGGPGPWLQASASDTMAPAVITLQPVPVQAGAPFTTGTYRATFHVLAPTAPNSPRTIVHTLVVIP